jgi:hypothetical protein
LVFVLVDEGWLTRCGGYPAHCIPSTGLEGFNMASFDQTWGSSANVSYANWYSWSTLAVDALRSNKRVELTVYRTQVSVESAGISPDVPAGIQPLRTMNITDPVAESPYTFWGRVSNACDATTDTFTLILNPGEAGRFLVDAIKQPVEIIWDDKMSWYSFSAQAVAQLHRGFAVQLSVERTAFSPNTVGIQKTASRVLTYVNPQPRSPFLFWGDVSHHCISVESLFVLFLAPGSAGEFGQPAITEQDLFVVPMADGDGLFWETFRSQAAAAQAAGGSVTLHVEGVRLPVVGVARPTSSLIGNDGQVNYQTFDAHVFESDLWNQVSSAFNLSSGGDWHFSKSATLPPLLDGNGTGDGSGDVLVTAAVACVVFGAVVYARRRVKRQH